MCMYMHWYKYRYACMHACMNVCRWLFFCRNKHAQNNSKGCKVESTLGKKEKKKLASHELEIDAQCHVFKKKPVHCLNVPFFTALTLGPETNLKLLTELLRGRRLPDHTLAYWPLGVTFTRGNLHKNTKSPTPNEEISHFMADGKASKKIGRLKASAFSPYKRPPNPPPGMGDFNPKTSRSLLQEKTQSFTDRWSVRLVEPRYAPVAVEQSHSIPLDSGEPLQTTVLGCSGGHLWNR